MGLIPWRKPAVQVEERGSNDPILGFTDYLNLITQFGYNGVQYATPTQSQEEIGPVYTSVARAAVKSNGVIFACMLVRMLLFAEARFQWRRDGTQNDLFGTADLKLLESPWPGGTTGDLLSRMIQHVDIGGNAFVARRPGKLAVLRPDWVKIVVGTGGDPESAAWDVDAEVLGYVYQPGGPGSGRDPVTFLAEEVAHFAPLPDPEARFRGMSWITPIIREVMADKAATEHKLMFFENAATPQLAVKLDVPDLEQMKRWIQLFRDNHEGAANAYKTLYLGAGADVTVVGANLQQLEFKVTQGAGETRIAAAAGVPPVIVGLSEGLQAATYSNYGQARRRFADGTMWPLWRNACGSLERIIPAPGGAHLWVDAADIPFLREDQLDQANILVQKSLAIKQLTEAGFAPDSAVTAVDGNDLSQLEHTGLVSVQLLPPGSQPNQPPAPAAEPSP